MRNETYVRPTSKPTKIVAAAILKDGKIWTSMYRWMETALRWKQEYNKELKRKHNVC